MIKANAKALAALFTGAGAWVSTAPVDGVITGAEWGQLAGVVIAAAVVWLTPNKRQRRQRAG